MLSSLKKKFRPEKGQIVVFTVLLLPLILGVVVLVIEIGNIYVHYSDLQNIADTAALTKNDESAKKVVDANSKNFSNKSDFAITMSAYQRNEKFCVKLEKDVPLIFFKIFGNTYKLEAYAEEPNVTP